MPWVVGIDEAGYGPNLGPLVQACVGLYLPDDDLTGWQALKSIVRRMNEPKDDRLVIDDSKLVYTRAGLEGLERTVLAVKVPVVYQDVGEEPIVHHLFDASKEYWYHGDRSLFEGIVDRTEIHKVMNHWTNLWITSGCGYPCLHIRTVATNDFNEKVRASGSKATVLADGIIGFLDTFQAILRISRKDSTNPVSITCDKLGGRNYYAPILQEAFPDGWPVAEVEGALESRYRILNVGREITVTFKPRADGENVCVALASMLAKYVREVCMKQFNEFWAKHVPGIKPTAGYPVDAKRFYSEIQEAMIRLGIPADAVWRKK